MSPWGRGYGLVSSEIGCTESAQPTSVPTLLSDWHLAYSPQIRLVEGAEMTAKGKHSPAGAGNIYAKANEVIVKITGADTGQTFEVVEENCKPGFQSRAHYHIKAYETFYLFEGSAEFQVGDEVFNATKGSCVH